MEEIKPIEVQKTYEPEKEVQPEFKQSYSESEIEVIEDDFMVDETEDLSE